MRWTIPLPVLSGNAAQTAARAPAACGEALSYGASTDSPAPLGVRIDGGRLVLDANDEGAEGAACVTVTAADSYGQSSSRTFSVTVEWAPAGHMRNWRLQWMRGLREAAQ